MRVIIFLLVFTISASAQNRPNIIFIEADDLMPRFMNKLGDGFGITPNLDKLASTGVYFKRSVSQGVMCSPSRYLKNLIVILLSGFLFFKLLNKN